MTNDAPAALQVAHSRVELGHVELDWTPVFEADVAGKVDVPPPPGAEADIWEDTTPDRRVVFTVPTCVLNRTGDPFRSPIVVAQAVQWADGSLDVTGVVEPPSVSLESPAEPGLSSSEARELAAALIAAADVIDGWVAR